MPCKSAMHALPSKKGTWRRRKTVATTFEEAAKKQRLRQSGPIEIRDGMVKRPRGRPKREYPNPGARIQPFEDVIMAVNPIIHELNEEPPGQASGPPPPTSASSPNEAQPPLRIIFQNCRGARVRPESTSAPSPMEMQDPKPGIMTQRRQSPCENLVQQAARPSRQLRLNIGQYEMQTCYMNNTSGFLQSPVDADAGAVSPASSFPATPSPGPYLTAAPGFVDISGSSHEQAMAANTSSCVDFARLNPFGATTELVHDANYNMDGSIPAPEFVYYLATGPDYIVSDMTIPPGFEAYH